jgi:phosphotransferase system  glucose/maltose/N-acetylglucosamine-specific IIC component
MLFGRRVRFAIIVLASQLLLIALAVVMLVQMILIATNGVIQFVEYNTVILTMEIILTLFITSFGAFVFIIQLRRLREKRNSDDRSRGNELKKTDQ